MLIFILIHRDPIKQKFTHKHRLCVSLSSLPCPSMHRQTSTTQREAVFLCINPPLLQRGWRKWKEGLQETHFQHYYISLIPNTQISQSLVIAYYTLTMPTNIQCMAAVHHSLPPLFILLSVGYSSWQLVFFCLERLCAMAALVPIHFIFCWHMPGLFQLHNVGNKICIILREGD